VVSVHVPIGASHAENRRRALEPQLG